MSAPGLRRAELPREGALAAAVLGLALVAWVAVAQRMDGMDAGPGSDLGGFAWYLGVWATMMAAMMLPSAVPMVLVFRRVNSTRAAKGQAGAASVWFFLAGYLVAWLLYGLVAYALYRLAAGLDWDLLSWDRGGRYVAAGIVAAAGAYQLTPLKQVCLRHCRGPMHFLLHGWRDGPAGAVRMGVEHGGYCVGCCWGLMLVLWAVGVMSITWMVVVAGLILLEKATPLGQRLTPVLAVGLVGLAIWIAASPGSVPALTVPGSPAAERAMDSMEGGAMEQPAPKMEGDAMGKRAPAMEGDAMGNGAP